MGNPVWGEGNSWALRKGEVLLGTLFYEGFDFPWVICRFEVSPAFSEYKPLFDAAWAIERDEQLDEFYAIYDRILELGIRLSPINPQHYRIGDFLLHIHEGEAHFRAVFE